MTENGTLPPLPKGFGSYINSEGQRVPMTDEQAQAIWDQCEAEKAQRAIDMPDEQSAINAMWRAQQRLRELGWKDAVYCPKDGSSFKVIEAGSTGIFDCTYEGEWPCGQWMLFDGRDTWPSHPTLCKLTPEAQAAHDEQMKKAGEAYREEMQLFADEEREVSKTHDSRQEFYE